MPNEREAAAVAANSDGCLACDLTSGRRELPGGRIYETPGPFLQTDMIDSQDAPPPGDVAAFAERARVAFDESQRLFPRASHAKSM